MDRSSKVRVEYLGSVYEIDIDAELRVDPQNVQDALLKQPGLYAWYATVHAATQSIVEKAKLDLDVLRARTDEKVRKEAAASGTKVTESSIPLSIDRDPEVVKASQALIEARRQEGVLRAVREAFTHRRDMLIQLSAMERQERSEYSNVK